MKTLTHLSQFDQVGNYFVSLVDRIEKDKKNSTIDFYQPKNIDKRILDKSFFYFPNEGDFIQKNCFEQNMDFYLALEKIYPNSKPSLINLFLDKDTIHSGILFTHNNEVHFADPVKKIIGVAKINNELIKIDKNLYSNSKDKIKFKKIFKAENQTLEKIITNLRDPQGIIDFFYSSGQVASSIDDTPWPKRLFMYIDKEFNVYGEIRSEDELDKNAKDNVLINLVYNPFEDSYSISTHTYSKSFWHNTSNRKKLTLDKNSKLNSHVQISYDVANYLKKTNMSFSSNSNLESRLSSLDELPKDFIEALKFDSQSLNYYLDYCLEEEGENFGKIYNKCELLFSYLIEIKGEEKKEKLSKEDTNKIMFKEINDRNRFQLFRLAYDFKKYCSEIRSNL